MNTDKSNGSHGAKMLTVEPWILDFDDTLVNSSELYRQAYIALWPNRSVPKISDIRTWFIDESFELTDAEKQQLFYYVRSSGMYEHAPPMDAAFDFWLRKLMKLGHQFIIVTANPEWVIPVIKKWLSKYDLNIPVYTVDNISDKAEFKAVGFVDDSPLLYQKLKQESDYRPLLFYCSNHNKAVAKAIKHDDCQSWCTLVRNFQEVYNIIKDYHV